LIKKILLYFFVFLSFLYLYREILYVGIRKNEYGIFRKFNEIFLCNKQSYDLLFLGSSRSEMHFNPKIIEEKTKLNSYNLGVSGATPRISNALFNAYLENNKSPKYIILNVDYFWLNTDEDILNYFPRYFPYLGNQTLSRELNKIDNRFNSFYYNPFYSIPYTQATYFSASLHGWLGIIGKYDSLSYKGFQTSELIKNDTTELPEPIISFISKKNKNDLSKLISFIKSRKIKLILVTSPIFGNGNFQVKNKKKLINEIEEIAYQYQIPYFNFTDSLNYNDLNLYSDYTHLNRFGANMFTTSISVILEKIIKKNK
jgi:hypothetical protein